MGDASGVEPLEGESEADYVARQARLREEAAARMRAKFGASGGLNGGVRMGGIGSQPASGGGGSWGIGEGLSSLGGSLSSLAGATIDVASSVREKVSEKVREKVSFDPMRDLGHLKGRTGSANSVVEGSKDISDLLGGCGLSAQHTSASAMPPPAASQQRGARAVAADDGWGDDAGWGCESTPAQSTAIATVAAPAAPTMPPASTPAPSVHYSGAASGTPSKKKVAATKVREARSCHVHDSPLLHSVAARTPRRCPA